MARVKKIVRSLLTTAHAIGCGVSAASGPRPCAASLRWQVLALCVQHRSTATMLAEGDHQTVDGV
jgi:hypothetical protein